jgi:hypothetical protein
VVTTYQGSAPEFERLPDIVRRLVAAGATEEHARTDICILLADRKIDFRVTVDQGDLWYAGQTLPPGNVAVPPRLCADDIDWTASRPRSRWEIGPDGGNLHQRYLSAASWEPRTVTLIEVRTEDVIAELVVHVDDAAEPIAAKPVKRQTPTRDRIEAAVNALWPGGKVPVGLSVGKRNQRILRWLTENKRETVDVRTINRFFGSK